MNMFDEFETEQKGPQALHETKPDEVKKAVCVSRIKGDEQ